MLGAALAAVAPLPGTRPAASTAAGARPVPAVAVYPQFAHAVPGRAVSLPPSTAQCRRRYGIACYQPRQLQRAYGLRSLYRRGITGRGQVIVVVDSFGSPTLRHDLAVFDRQAGLPEPPSLRVIQPAGKVPPYRPTASRVGWAGETDLDVQYAHTIAPGARILVVETPASENEGTSGFPQIVRAEKYVIAHHLGTVISQSFGATEQTFPSRAAMARLRGAYTAAAAQHITVLAAAGDTGAADVRHDQQTFYPRRVTSWPDSDPLVTAVGGTRLRLGPRGQRIAPDTAWNDTFSRATQRFLNGSVQPTPLAGGGGRSVFFGRPAFQRGVAAVTGPHRGVPDISMSAACNGAVDMYQSFRGQPAGWYPACGTSEATPEFAGIIALAAQQAGHPLGLGNPLLYRLAGLHASGLLDVRHGQTTVQLRQNGRHRVAGFRATAGYDLATGTGTVRGPAFTRQLAAAFLAARRG
jgi:subtilase family serine protease